MSSYIQKAYNPRNNKVEEAEYLDNYFGPRKYGVRFSDGRVYADEEVKPFYEEDGNTTRLTLPKSRLPRLAYNSRFYFVNDLVSDVCSSLDDGVAYGISDSYYRSGNYYHTHEQGWEVMLAIHEVLKKKQRKFSKLYKG